MDGIMTNKPPSTRILEIREWVADTRMEEVEKEPTYKMMSKVTGVTREEARRSLLMDGKTMCAAISLYLDEAAGFPSPCPQQESKPDKEPLPS